MRQGTLTDTLSNTDEKAAAASRNRQTMTIDLPPGHRAEIRSERNAPYDVWWLDRWDEAWEQWDDEAGDIAPGIEIDADIRVAMLGTFHGPDTAICFAEIVALLAAHQHGPGVVVAFGPRGERISAVHTAVPLLAPPASMNGACGPCGDS